MENIIFFGGDKRQQKMVKQLSEKGYKCKHINSGEIAEVEIENNDIVIFPIPVSKDRDIIYSTESDFKIKVNDVLKKTNETNMVFGGSISNAMKHYMKDKKTKFFDYLECDELAVYNAYLTGCASLKLLYENTDSDIRDTAVLVTGFGRVARYTAQTLKKAGCNVYVSARSKLQLAEAECMGYKVIDFERKGAFLYLFDYVFNTVPENIFSYEDINHMKGKYFELASAPFGVRKEYFRCRENDYINGGSLPGRYMPRSAAEKLVDITIEHIKLRNGGD